MAIFPFPHFTPTTLLYFFILTPPSLAINVTTLLSSFPYLSDFISFLTSSSIAADLAQRSSVTLLTVPNPNLATSSGLRSHLPLSSLADVLRYHILLEYISFSDLQQIPPSGTLVTTLFQTTGRATSNFGSVNITRNPLNGDISIRSAAPYSASNATVLGLIKNVPYNVSVFSVSSLLVPNGIDLMASDSQPPVGLNLTAALINGHVFNVAASMLAASGVVEEFEADEGGAGITLFVPTDSAFSHLPPSVSLKALPAERKAVILKFHVLHSYYPLGSLESIVNPVQPTLATEENGAGSYTLDISRVNGSVAIDSGIVQASVTQTVFDQNPVAIFGVSEVLLPREIYGKTSLVTTKPDTGAVVVHAQPPGMEDSPGFDSPTSLPEVMQSEASVMGGTRFAVALYCMALYLLGVVNSLRW